MLLLCLPNVSFLLHPVFNLKVALSSLHSAPSICQTCLKTSSFTPRAIWAKCEGHCEGRELQNFQVVAVPFLTSKKQSWEPSRTRAAALRIPPHISNPSLEHSEPWHSPQGSCYWDMTTGEAKWHLWVTPGHLSGVFSVEETPQTSPKLHPGPIPALCSCGAGSPAEILLPPLWLLLAHLESSPRSRSFSTCTGGV